MEGSQISEPEVGRMPSAGKRGRLRILASVSRTSWCRDLALLVILIMAAVGVRAWLISHTEVAARDSIGYIRYAWQLKNRPWSEVIRTSESHPGYPVAIFAVSEVLRPFSTASESVLMQMSAQLTNALAAVLLVIPMFFLGRELFDRRIGFWGAMLFQILPASGRVLSDGLSEGVFFLWAASSLWMACLALRKRSALCFGLAGMFGGLAYLTRPEGALLVAVIGLVLLALQAWKETRLSWTKLVAYGGALGLAAAAVASPFVATTQRLTTKPTAHILLEKTGLIEDGEQGSQAPLSPALQQGVALASIQAVWWEGQDEHTSQRTRWALQSLLIELARGNYYLGWIPGLIALWWYRDRLKQVPGVWVLLLICLILTAVLWRMAFLVGYLSNRHTLLIILCDIYWVAAGLLLLGRGLRWLCVRWRLTYRVPVLAIATPCIPMLLSVAAAYPKTFEPLHANRAGFRDVGLWLAQNTTPTDPVIDPYYWSHYYSGRVFTEGTGIQSPSDHRPVRYVVLERAGLDHLRLPLLPEAEKLKEQGRLVYSWKGPRVRSRAEVFVYAVPVQ